MEGHPTYHVNMTKLKWEIIWTGRLPYLPGVPNLHVVHLSIETPNPPPQPGLCGAMWGIFMVFEGMVSPWWWGISLDLLSIFMEVGERGGDLTHT